MKEKQKMDYALLRKILSYLTPFRSKLPLIILCLACTTVLGFLQPLVIRTITDDGLVNQNLRTIVTAVLFLLGLVLADQGIELWMTKIFANIHIESVYMLFSQAFDKLLRLRKSFYDDKNNAELLDSVSRDVQNVSLITDRYIAMVLGQVFRIFSGVAGLLLINWKLTLVILTVVPVKYVTVRMLSKRYEKKIEEYIERNRDFSAWFGDTIDGIDEIKLWNLRNPKRSIFSTKQRALLKTEKDCTMISAQNTFVETLLEWLVTGLIYVIGGLFVIGGELTVGGVFAFISYSSYITGPISSVLNVRFFLSRIFPSAKRLFTLLESEEEASGDGAVAVKQDTAIQFHSVSFRYDETDRDVLRDINVTVKRGEKIAIIGQNGSGKSTLLHLLLWFIEPSGGVITLDGQDIQDLALHEYRNIFAVVSQELYFFFSTQLKTTSI